MNSMELNALSKAKVVFSQRRTVVELCIVVYHFYSSFVIETALSTALAG